VRMEVTSAEYRHSRALIVTAVGFLAYSLAVEAALWLYQAPRPIFSQCLRRSLKARYVSAKQTTEARTDSKAT
jgi:hypothetical protein